jgi:CRISPR-associated protein Csd1
MTSPWSGLKKTPPETDKFITVTLTAVGPRIVIKDWLQMSLMDAAENFKRWFVDLSFGEKQEISEIPPSNGEEESAPLAITRLAGCTAPLTSKAGRLVPDYDKLQSDVVAQLYRAALKGTPPSVVLLTPILNQLHSKLVRDENYQILYDQSRFALLKLILNRNRKNTDMEIKTELTADTADAAYNCGRLLAILAAAQDKAHDYKLEGAGVAERYFGTASSSPGSVFPLLLRLNRHHLNKISKSNRFAGHERFIGEQIQGVCALFKSVKPGLAPAFPRTLDLQAQGRFALGFYQQMAADAAARQANRKDNDTESETKTK